LLLQRLNVLFYGLDKMAVRRLYGRVRTSVLFGRLDRVRPPVWQVYERALVSVRAWGTQATGATRLGRPARLPRHGKWHSEGGGVLEADFPSKGPDDIRQPPIESWLQNRLQ
jgi:hypothetical protein